jgi:phosphoribosylformylglycinamidine cyclo-ligase
VQARLRRTAWTRPPIFDWLQATGGVADAEMHRVFNCGIGMVVIVAREHADEALRLLAASGESAQVVGEVVARADGAPATVVV